MFSGKARRLHNLLSNGYTLNMKTSMLSNSGITYITWDSFRQPGQQSGHPTDSMSFEQRPGENEEWVMYLFKGTWSRKKECLNYSTQG